MRPRAEACGLLELLTVGQLLRHELGRLEDEAAATGWTWDAALSFRLDALHVQLEGKRA